MRSRISLATMALLALSSGMAGAAGTAVAGTTAAGTVDAGLPAPTVADVDRSIGALLGDPQAFRDVFDRLQRGVASGDKAGVAALVAYPLNVAIGGKRRRIANAAEFVASWDGIITPEVARVIASQRYQDLFVNAQGAMLGNGQVWLSGVCRDPACARSDVRVTAIQQGPS